MDPTLINVTPFTYPISEDLRSNTENESPEKDAPYYEPSWEKT